MPRIFRARRKPRIVRRRGRGFGLRRTFGSAMYLAKKAYSGYKYLKSLVNVERKFFDSNQVNQSIGSTAAVYPLTQIGTGDTYNTREGLSIKAISWLLRMSFVMNTSAEQTFVRVLLISDSEQRGTSPTGAEILESNADYLSPINHLNGLRFQVLMDHTVNLTKTLNAKQMKKFSKFSHHIKYSDTSSTDTKEGNLYLLIVSDQSTNTPMIDYDFRLRFIDN